MSARSILRFVLAIGLLVAGVLAGAFALAMFARSAGTSSEQTTRMVAALLVVVTAAIAVGFLPLIGRRMSIIGSVVMLAIVALAGWLAGSAFLAATSYAPQKRTMTDIRSLSAALEARATDMGDYPNVSLDALASQLQPTYIREMPRVDGWGFPLRYETWGKAPDVHYRVGSAGKHGQWERSRLRDYPANALTQDPAGDIVFGDGTFIQSPR